MELVVDCRCVLGEGPFWHEGKAWWLNILGKEIHRFDPVSCEHQKYSLPCMVTAVVPRENGGFIAATEFGIAVIESEGWKLEHKTESGIIPADIRFNDGKCDPAGRFWAGTMHRKAQAGRGTLFLVEEDFQPKQMVKDVTISNGLAWSADSKTFYYIDSLTRRIDAFDYDLATGSIGNRRAAIVFPKDQPGVPDGMSIDSEGFLWVAVWGGACILRCDPRSGEIVEKFAVPVSQPSSCCFGGEDLSDLYITSAREGLTEEELEKEPQAGGLFRMKTSVKGLPAQPCRN